jgi:hypothetical protein
MERSVEPLLLLSLAAMVTGIGVSLGWRHAGIGLVFSVIWFIIAMVLLARPPGIPQVTQHRSDSDLPMVSRKDSFPILPKARRLRIALSVACGVCLVFWMMLVAA